MYHCCHFPTPSPPQPRGSWPTGAGLPIGSTRLTTTCRACQLAAYRPQRAPHRSTPRPLGRSSRDSHARLSWRREGSCRCRSPRCHSSSSCTSPSSHPSFCLGHRAVDSPYIGHDVLDVKRKNSSSCSFLFGIPSHQNAAPYRIDPISKPRRF